MRVKEAIEQASGNEEMWQQLDKAIAETGAVKKPEGSFSMSDFMDRYQVDRNIAYNRIRRMMDNGKVVAVGRFGNKTYYQLVKL
jgi:hypothetical protein